jgi:hypothetical protein
MSRFAVETSQLTGAGAAAAARAYAQVDDNVMP